MTAQNNNPLVELSNALADAAERAGAATVLVDARRHYPASGILYAPGLVLTADHVVERDEDIRVIFPGEGQVEASIAGRDPGSDLAVLRVSQSQAAPAELAPEEARIGQIVLAIGRPSPDGIQASLGVISAIGGPVRTRRGGLLDRYLATDAIPYPGFSGGPLVDAAGRVLGLNTSGLARGSSLAIPAGLAWKVAEALVQHGRVRRGYLGIRSQPVDLPVQGQQALGRDQKTGLLVVWIEENSPAAQGGLMIGDILVGLDRQPLADHDELLTRLSGMAGGQAAFEVLRGGQPQTVTLTVGERER